MKKERTSENFRKTAETEIFCKRKAKGSKLFNIKVKKFKWTDCSFYSKKLFTFLLCISYFNK